MGYNSRFYLEMSNMKFESDEFQKILTHFNKTFQHIGFLYEGISIKWSRWDEIEDNMKMFSNWYPGLIFRITRLGEEWYYGDLERFYFCNGKCQKSMAKISFSEYDPFL